MSLTITQKNHALVALFARSQFTTNDVMQALTRSGVDATVVETEAVDLVQEWLSKEMIREKSTGVWTKKRS